MTVPNESPHKNVWVVKESYPARYEMVRRRESVSVHSERRGYRDVPDHGCPEA